ncbi:MAG: PKD domain-containing protein [Flavobacteriales bacterium]|nr:PKD domain-containing protein [Flavobacteriales bacterium]
MTLPLFRTGPWPALLILLILATGTAHAQLTVAAGTDVTICAGSPTILGGAAATGGTPPYTYTWGPAAGLGSTNGLHPVCTATATTTYTLTATDAGGLTGTDQVTVTVKPVPAVNLTCTNGTSSIYGGVLTFSVCGLGANPYNFDFTDATSALPGATYSITWGNGQTGNFGGSGWSSTQQFPFGLSTGTYTVQQPAPNNCSITVPFNVFVGEVPLGGLSVVSNSSVCTGSPVSFEWNNFNTNPPGTLYIVDYGDGNIDTLPQPPQAAFDHIYTQSSCAVGGEYTIAWSITNPCDVRTGSINQIRVSGAPVADFTISPNDTACVNSTVSFTDISQGTQAPTCVGPKHIWSISPATGWTAAGTLGNTNGQPTVPGVWTSGAASLGVTFNTPGTYTVTDVAGNICSVDTVVRTLCVEQPPQPAFTALPTTGCTPLVVNTDNNSTSPNSCSTRYLWSTTVNSPACGSTPVATFSGGTNAGTFEPQLTLAGAGNYTVHMQAINACGTFPVSQSVSVGAPPQVALNAISGICEGQSISPTAMFSACGTPITGYWWSTPGGNPTNSTSQVPGAVSYAAAGSYSITASALSACSSSLASAPLTVSPLPAAPVVGGPITVCVGEDLQLQATPVPGVTFQWSGPNGFTSSLPNPLITAVTSAAQGTYTVSATAGGCSGPSNTVGVTVNPAPVLVIAPAAPSVCAGDAVTLTATGGANFQWDAGGVPVGSGSPFTFWPSVTTTLVLHGDANGCTGASSTLLTVHPLPVVDAGSDQVFCESTVPQPLGFFPLGGVWSGSPQVDNNGVFTPSVQGTFTLVYTATSPQGCANTDVVVITVAAPPPPADAGNDTTICLNAPAVQFTGLPAGGSWNGDISIGGLFHATAPGTFTLDYTLGTGSCSSSDQAVVTVPPLPVINAGADQQVCIDLPAFPLNATPAGGTWTGAGITGGSFDPQMAGTGTQVLTYAFTDGNGCSNADTRNITVHALPVVQAGSDITFCDQPMAQQIAGFSPPGGAWSGPNVSPGGSFLPSGPGTFNLVYTYADGNGCTATDQLAVTVITITNPAFAGNDTAVCIGSGVLPLAGSPAAGTWSGPQVNAAGLFDPMVDGLFTLTYSLGNGSCITQDQVDITVHALPVIVLAGLDDACVDEGPRDFSATPVGGAWGGNGITDPLLGTFNPAVAGTGNWPISYTFTDANGCTNSLVQVMAVLPLPVAAFSHGPIACASAPFPFTNASTGATAWNWDFGDGGTSTAQSPTHTFAAEGTYTTSLTAFSGAGCTHTTTSTVTVWAGPQTGFHVDVAEGCGPLAVTATNTSSGNGLSYAWDLGDGNTSTDPQPAPHTFAASLYGDTTYTITLAVSNLCGTVDSSVTITVHPLPTALFGPDFDSGCSPWPVTFSNVTIGQAASYHWDFGDGTTSTTADSLVQHTYYTGTTDSVYTIALAATNACGSDTAHYTITTLPNTITAFFNTDTTSGCAPLTVQFTQYSIGVTNWHWDLGDGNVSTAVDVGHTFTDPGSYTVTLFGDNGCSHDTVSVDITVHPTALAAFSIAPGLHCAGAPVLFTNNSPAPAGLQWDFGDGGTSTLSAPAHSYAMAGTYTVTLTVASTTTPCPAVLAQTVTVQPTPGAAILADPSSGCAPLPVQFTNGSTNGDLQQWDFGDGNTSGLPAPLHTFGLAGTYTVQLVAENIGGCTDTASITVTVHPVPSSAFTMANEQSCTSPAPLQLHSAATGAVGHAWDFGNGTGSTLNNPVAVFSGPGTYTITLTVENQYGCTDDTTGVYTVHPTPVAAFSLAPQPACAGYPVYFQNLSVNASSFQWWFGDGAVSNEAAPAHAYAAGDHAVTLLATGAGGCTDTITVAGAVHMDPTPTAAFSYQPMQSTSYALQFFNQSIGAISWLWDFGDGTQSTEQEPLHLFPAGPDNLYPFCLVAINDFGCPDTLCQPVVAVSNPDVYVPNAFTPDGDGLNETFRPVLNGFEKWSYAFLVFDRWGEQVHYTRDRHAAWDGTCRGKPVKGDVYVWKVVLNRDGDERVYYGHVTVVSGTD